MKPFRVVLPIFCLVVFSISILGQVDWMIAFAEDLRLQVGRLDVSRERLDRMTSEEQVAYVWERARETRVLPPDVEVEEFRRLFELFKANKRALLDYSPTPLPSQATSGGRIALWRAGAMPPNEFDPTLGCARVALEPVEVRQAPGDHYTMLHPPHAQTLAEQSLRELDEAQSAG